MDFPKILYHPVPHAVQAQFVYILLDMNSARLKTFTVNKNFTLE